MKIIQIHNLYQMRGGEERVVVLERKLLAEEGHEVFSFQKDNRDISSLNLWQKIKLFFSTTHSFQTVKELKALLQNHKFDLALVHNVFPLISPAVYFLLNKFNIPIIQTVHNFRYFCQNGQFFLPSGEICDRCMKGNFIHGIIRKCYRNSFLQTTSMAMSLFVHSVLKTFKKRIDIYIAPSALIKRKLIEGRFPPDKIRVKPHFVDVPAPAQNLPYRNYAVYMGRLSQEKGVAFLIDAWAEVKDIDLKIVGTGPLEFCLRTQVENQGITNIEFLGYIAGEKRFEILRQAMFLIFPSECYESFGLAIIESFACGVPVIGTDLEGIDELIIAGRTGFRFEKRNLADIVEKINCLKNDPELVNCLKKQSFEFYKERYSPEVSIRKIKAIMGNAAMSDQ